MVLKLTSACLNPFKGGFFMALHKLCCIVSILFLGVLVGCSSSPGSASQTIQTSSISSAAAQAGQFVAPDMLTSVFDEAAATGANGVQIDTSHLAQGYVAVRATVDGKLKFLLSSDSSTLQYSYLIPNDGTPAIIPLQLGNGTYQFAVCKNIEGTKYSYLYRQSEQVTLSDEFQPFLRPSIYINYTADSACVKKAAELASQANTQMDVVTNIYNFIVTTISYDKTKAETIGTDYLPNPDETLQSKSGICVDYAALAAAMLRSQGIPTKLITGYVAPNNLYHAWNMVWLEDTGWITVELKVDKNTWNRIDATFAAGGADASYIGDGSNYTDYLTY